MQLVARRQHENRNPEPTGAEPARNGDAVEARHGDVEHDQVRNGTLDLDQRVGAVDGERHVVALGAERPAQHPPDRRIVVDDEDRGLGHAPMMPRAVARSC